MTFEECELAILRQAVDENEKAQGEKLINNEQIMTMIKILHISLTSPMKQLIALIKRLLLIRYTS